MHQSLNFIHMMKYVKNILFFDEGVSLAILATMSGKFGFECVGYSFNFYMNHNAGTTDMVMLTLQSVFQVTKIKLIGTLTMFHEKVL